jgi:two-component system OmpR family sensor kinase
VFSLTPRRVRDANLRTKLVAVVLALMALAFVAVAAATTFALRNFLLGQLDEQVQEASTRFAVLLGHPGETDADRDVHQFDSVAGQAAGTLGARLRGSHVIAAAVVTGVRGGVRPLGVDDRELLPRLPVGGPMTVSFHGVGEYQVLVSRGAGAETLVTGLPTGPVDGTVHRLIAIELVVYAIALGAVGVLAPSLVRLTMRPLSRITSTAARVANLPLTADFVSLSADGHESDQPAEISVPHPGAAQTEIGTLSAAFDRMLRNVEQSFAARQASEQRLRRFLGDASHELRTPVAVIRGHAELARTAPDVPAEVDHALERIVGESQRMGHLVDDLLLLARLNSDRAFEPTEVDLTRIVLDTVSDARAAGPEHHWKLDLPDEPVEVSGDPDAVHQVVANLLANARVHTPPGTTVLTALRGTGPDAEIAVSDDGPGIPPDVLPNIFERFVHADPTRATATGGSGLGLAIVDAIVRRHGGSTTVTSEPGETRFVVRLPASRPDGP